MNLKHNLRKTGIDVIGDVPWGTHFCQFYETKQDLLDVLVPYFKKGLLNNEFCMWITADPLSVEEAKVAMKKAMPDFEKYVSKGHIEIIPYDEWYTKGGGFKEDRVLNGWVSKLKDATAKGLDGLRLTGNTFWIEKKDWKAFSDYEETVNNVIGKYRMLAMCTYSLRKCTASEIIDVISTHQFALIKRLNKWDIIESSDYKKTKEALRQSEERYRSYIELTEQLAWTTNARGEVEEDIPAWRKFTGQSYGEVKGAGWSKALHPDDLKSTIKAWNKAVATKSPYEVEYRVRRFDGVYRHLLVRGIPVFKENGSIREWIGTCIDITGRKKAEAELAIHAAQLESLNRSLQEESVRKEALLESIGDGVIAMDVKGKIIALNKKTEAIFGWKTKDILGKSIFSEFKLADEQDKIIPKDLRPIQLALTTAQVGHGIYFLIKKGAEKIPLFITSAPVILDGIVVGAVNIYRDVSQQVATDRAKDEFLYFASHTLRTPLSAIAWSIERLSEDGNGYSTEQKKFLDRIYEQTQRMIQLTNDLLDATRMEFGILSYKYEEANPLKVASDVIEDLKNRIKDKKIKFELISGKNIKSYQTYTNAIYMILHNLLSNAVKFTPINGTVSLKISRTDKDLILQVSDSGLGIPKAAQARIFQKMYRAHNVKDKFEGSGLGLYITSGIINHMGGKITVKSTLRQGTAFTVILPLALEIIQSKQVARINL